MRESKQARSTFLLRVMLCSLEIPPNRHAAYARWRCRIVFLIRGKPRSLVRDARSIALSCRSCIIRLKLRVEAEAARLGNSKLHEMWAFAHGRADW